MAKLKVTLTNEHITLISNIRFKEAPVIEENDSREHIDYAIDMNNLYGGNFLYEDISYLLGIYDQHIEGTEEEPTGVEFPKELEDHMFELHSYIVENIGNIEEILHQFCGRGGLKAGTYICDQNIHLWEFSE